jgi:ribosomal protein L37AE/L43A
VVPLIAPLSAAEFEQRQAAGAWIEPEALPELWNTIERIRVVMHGLIREARGTSDDARPLADELDTITQRDVRPHVQPHQASVLLLVNGKRTTVALAWRPITKGLLGPRSSRAALKRRSMPVDHRIDEASAIAEGLAQPDPELNADRGGVAWRLQLQCPECDRPCEVLRSPIGLRQWACGKCRRPAALSNRWPRSNPMTARSAADRAYRQHTEAAARLAVRLLKAPANVLMGNLGAPVQVLCPKPPGMRWDRYQRICRVLEAHRALGQMAYLRTMRADLERISPGIMGDLQLQQVAELEAYYRAVLLIEKDVTKRSSWARRGHSSNQAVREWKARQQGSPCTHKGAPARLAA